MKLLSLTDREQVGLKVLLRQVLENPRWISSVSTSRRREMEDVLKRIESL